MSDLDILVSEIARVALQDSAFRMHIAEFLDISDDEIDRVKSFLDAQGVTP